MKKVVVLGMVACGLWSVTGWAEDSVGVESGNVWGWLAMIVLPALAGEAWRQMRGGPYWARLSVKHQLLATIVSRVVSYVYLRFVREWKKANGGKLTEGDKRAAMSKAVEMVQTEARANLLEPLLKDETGVVDVKRIEGMVQAEVARQKVAWRALAGVQGPVAGEEGSPHPNPLPGGEGTGKKEGIGERPRMRHGRGGGE